MLGENVVCLDQAEVYPFGSRTADMSSTEAKGLLDDDRGFAIVMIILSILLFLIIWRSETSDSG